MSQGCQDHHTRLCRFIEFYNLVFMEHNRDAEGQLTPLAQKNIDTGLGLERMAQILQGVPNNYETDLILPIVDKAAQLAGMQYASAVASQKTDLKVLTLIGLLTCRQRSCDVCRLCLLCLGLAWLSCPCRLAPRPPDPSGGKGMHVGPDGTCAGTVTLSCGLQACNTHPIIDEFPA